MASILHITRQLEDLRADLEFDGNIMSGWLNDKGETGEDLAKVAAHMSEVAGILQMNVATFLEGWDFTEDCRKAREKEAAGAAAAPAQAGAEAKA